MNTALEYSTRVVQEGGRRCKKSTLNDLVHLTPLRIPLMNPPLDRDLDSPTASASSATAVETVVPETAAPAAPSCTLLSPPEAPTLKKYPIGGFIKDEYYS